LIISSFSHYKVNKALIVPSFYFSILNKLNEDDVEGRIEKMNILFAYPDYQHRDKSPPLGLMYVAAVLEQHGHTVKILDFSVEKPTNFSTSLQEADIFGLSFTSQQFHEAKKLINQARNISEKIKILIGGPHATIYEKEVFTTLPNIDYVTIGEGEYTALDLVNGIHPSKVQGLIWKGENGEIQINPSRSIIKNLDDLPFPARHLVPMTKYSCSGTILTSRGCPFRCIYCFKKAGRTWRAHSTDYVISEMNEMRQKYNIRDFHLCDDLFLANPTRANEIADAILTKNWKVTLNLWGGSRVDVIAKNEPLIEKLANAGLRKTGLGLESVIPEVLETARKDITLEEVEKAITILRKYGVSFFVFLMVGLPNDTYENVEKTKQWIVKNKIKEFGVSLATPYPRTELWDYVNNHGRWLVSSSDVQKDFSYHTVTKVYPMWDTPDFPAEQRMRALIELIRFSAIRTGYISRDRLAIAIKQPRLMFEWFKKWLKLYF
jgi:anaerobic magnesium-protoporphyrin IX monomethyl ester cyclase